MVRALPRVSLPLTIAISLTLLFTSTLLYPGGSQADARAVGFDWRSNYISDLLGPYAVDGVANAGRPWAVCGIALLCGSIALFFVRFASRAPSKGSARVIRYGGVGSMVFAFLAATPFHDSAVTLGDILGLVSTLYVTVLVFRSGPRALKALSVANLAAAYACTYVYYARNGVAFLPVMQKVALLVQIAWVLSLDASAEAVDPRDPPQGAVP